MANSRPIVALNVGSQRVSMGVFSKTSKDALILDRYATRLVVLDPSAEGLRLTKIGEAIADLVQELNVKGSVVNYSVSGQSVFIRFVKLPALDDTDVEQLIRFEAQQHVPFPLDEVVWDYHLLPAKGLEREAILVAIKAEDLDSLNDEIISHGLSTGKVDCALTSLYNAY
ncbi:MAG: pilus assembly protein PilM, partial [Akkermansia sp.]|nr:pilus assembly protein PilM [Akkermansia sp.]